MSQALHLAIFHNDELIEKKTLIRDVIVIGKLESSHLRLDDDSVARMHAVIEMSGRDVRIVDLGSSTGTFLNGHRVEKSAVIEPGDVLSFGPYRVEVAFAETASAAPAAAVARPVVQIDLSEVERQDGTSVAEVMALYNRTVLDVQHVGQVKSKRATAPVFVGIGGIIVLVGLGLFGYEVSQDWETYEKALQESQATGQLRPQEPGLGTGGLGLALALLGLVPFTVGVVRSQDRALSSYLIGEGI